MPKPRASDSFFNAFQSQVTVATSLSDTLEDKKKFWRANLNYDPFGEYGAEPHPGQMQIHTAMADPKIRVVLIRAGKRGGKSTAAQAEAIYQLFRRKHVWVASANYDLTKPIFDPIWTQIAGGMGIPVTFRDRRKMRLEVAGGGFIAGKTWENEDQLEAEGVHLVIADELQKINEYAWQLLVARTADTQGRLLGMGSEQENSVAFDDLCEQATIREGWRFITWKTEDNPAFHTPAGAAWLRTQREEMSEEAYQALYEARKRPDHEVVFPEFSVEDHVKDLKWREGESVTLWIDPGHNYYAVLAVQFITDHLGRETVHVIDEVYLSPATNATAIAEVRAQPWWVDVDNAVIDVAGKQHGPNSELSPVEEWTLRAKIAPRYQVISIPDGIEKTHLALRDPANGRPRILFNSTCVNTIAEFRGLYRYRHNRQGGRSGSDRPLDKHNHAAKAIAYGLVDHWPNTDFKQWIQPEPTYSGSRGFSRGREIQNRIMGIG